MYCAVYGCKNCNIKKKVPNHSYFRFPKNIKLCKKWVIACGRQDKFNIFDARICDEHFREDDYKRNPFLEQYGLQGARRLLPGAVPLMNLPLRRLNKSSLSSLNLSIPPAETTTLEKFSSLSSSSFMDFPESNVATAQNLCVPTSNIEQGEDSAQWNIGNFTGPEMAELPVVIKQEPELMIDDYQEHESLELIFPAGQTSSTQQRDLQCDICQEYFSNSNDMRCHMNVHIAYYTSSAPDSLNATLITERNKQLFSKIDAVTYQCKICGKSVSRSSHLSEHFRTHSGEKPYECNLCQKTFTKKLTLDAHMNLHTGERPHRCELCSKKFTYPSGLYNHLRTHSDKKSYKCTLCSLSFITSYSLRRHISAHTGEKSHQCSVCQKSFAQSGDLRKHILTHTGEKPYECDVCSKSFSQKSNLQAHLNTHQDEKRHRCKQCSKSFRTAESLRVHISYHNKSHKCKICEKSFALSSHLRRHLKAHTGERPHQCNVCQKSFAQSHGLKRHLKTHT